ncbi:hypothetical protein Tco_0833221 [Tanacetum coccineum]
MPPTKTLWNSAFYRPNSGSTRNRCDVYSTFYKTSNKMKFSEEEWDKFTEESTDMLLLNCIFSLIHSMRQSQ